MQKQKQRRGRAPGRKPAVFDAIGAGSLTARRGFLASRTQNNVDPALKPRTAPIHVSSNGARARCSELTMLLGGEVRRLITPVPETAAEKAFRRWLC